MKGLTKFLTVAFVGGLLAACGQQTPKSYEYESLTSEEKEKVDKVINMFTEIGCKIEAPHSETTIKFILEKDMEELEEVATIFKGY